MRKVTKWILGILGCLIVLLLIAILIFWKDIQEIRGVLRYAQTFEQEHINDNFRSLYKQYPSKTMQHAGPVFNLPANHRNLMPGKDNPASGWSMGYGYQWWIPENPEGDFMAIGIYGQFIYVYPGHKVVIAKSSAYVDYNNTGDAMELESVEAFRAIARGL